MLVVSKDAMWVGQRAMHSVEVMADMMDATSVAETDVSTAAHSAAS